MIDRVYGKIEISDPLARDIIASAAFQRLRGVDQAGYKYAFDPEYVHSRFEHSIGVYALLGAVEASRDERISGLIHDLSHTAFSHCTDYAIKHAGDVTNLGLQDDMHVDFVNSTEIPGIILEHGLDIDRILDEHNFPLLEQPLPALCADRIDYSLRGAIMTGMISSEALQNLLNQLIAIDQKWVYKTPQAARTHADIFKKLTDDNWSGLETGVMFYSVGEFLKRAFELGLVSFDQMHATDVEILQKITPFVKNDPELSRHWLRMNNEVPYHNDEEDYEVEIAAKSRAIDPLCIEDNEIKPLSQTKGNEDWQAVVLEDMQPNVYHLRFDD